MSHCGLLRSWPVGISPLSPLTLAALFFHFTLFTACYPISSFSQALELVTDAVPASPLPNVPLLSKLRQLEQGLSKDWCFSLFIFIKFTPVFTTLVLPSCWGRWSVGLFFKHLNGTTGGNQHLAEDSITNLGETSVPVVTSWGDFYSSAHLCAISEKEKRQNNGMIDVSLLLEAQ